MRGVGQSGGNHLAPANRTQVFRNIGQHAGKRAALGST